MIQASGLKAPLYGIVLICAAKLLANSAVLLHFLGPWVGVYISLAVAVLFLEGGLLQGKQTA